MKLQRWLLYRGCYKRTNKGDFIRASEVESLEAKCCALEKRVDALQKVLSDVADFANAHDLPCLEDILRQETEVSQ
jgi:hypothetical protein